MIALLTQLFLMLIELTLLLLLWVNQNHGLHAYIEDLTGWVGNPTGGSDTSRTVSLLLKGLAMMY